MQEELKELTIVEGLMEARIIQSELENFGIPCLLQFETAGRLLGLTMNGLGQVRVMVSPVDYQRAREIMDSENEQTDDNESSTESEDT